MLVSLLLAALLSGCLPIGIRGTSLPNYAGPPAPALKTADRNAAA
jgi:hypothetical protein